MSGSGQFCPACGKPINGSPDTRPVAPDAPATHPEPTLCDACYFERFDLVIAPDQLQIRVCPRCGAVHRGNRWVDIGASDYTDIAVEAVQDELGVHVNATDVEWHVSPEQVDPNTIRMHATFRGRVRGTPVEETVTVPVTISRETCTRCGRIAGDYYASVVQLRAAGRTPSQAEQKRATSLAESITAEMEATGDRNAFVTEISRLPEGLDIKVSTSKIGQKIARRLIDEYGGTLETSQTLVTEDEDGNEVYRVTYAVRLPRFTPGDVIQPDDTTGPVVVTSVHGNLKGRQLPSGDPYEAPFEASNGANATRIGRVEDADETTVVAIEDDYAVQILDPETAEAKTVPRPPGITPDTKTVRVLKTPNGLHVLPDE